MSTDTTTDTTSDTGQTTFRRTTTPSSTTPATWTERSAANRLRDAHVSRKVLPVAVTAGDTIKSLRQWAPGRCLPSDRAGAYSRSDVGGARGRRVMRAE